MWIGLISDILVTSPGDGCQNSAEFMCQLEWNVKTFSKIEASNAILFSYPVFFVHVIIIDCCSNIYWKVCISAVGTCYGMAM
jgi:hypothetical protein